MLVLGLLSIVQVVFLPGYLAIKLLKIRDGKIISLVLSFALSLIINHFIVFILTTLHLYTRWSIYSLFIGECLLFIYFLNHPLPDKFHDVRTRNTAFSLFPENANMYQVVVYFMAAATLFYYTVLFIGNLGQIFNAGDDVVSWNRWAVDWYKGSFPQQTWHYPQLLPTLWSISYLFIGNSSVQFFAKAIMPLFPLFLLLLMFDLGLRTRKTGYILSTCITGVLLYYILGGPQLLTSGYADIPVAFMAFLSVYLLVVAKYSETPSEVKKHLLIGSFCCAGGALTKQAGLYVAAIYPLLSYLIVLRVRPDVEHKNKFIIVLYSLITMCTLPWYVYTQLRITYGLEESEVSHVTQGIYNGISYLQRLLNAFIELELRFYDLYAIVRQITVGTVIASVFIVFIHAVIVGCLLFCLKDRLWKYLLLLVAVPFYIIWAFFFSYDLRNSALAIPFFGAALGIGARNLFAVLSSRGKQKFKLNDEQALHGIIAFFSRRRVSPRGKPAGAVSPSGTSNKSHSNLTSWIAISSLLILLAGLAYYVDDAYLIRRQSMLRREIAHPAINRMLYDSEVSTTSGLILTDYQFVDYLPGFESRAIFCEVNDEVDFFRSLRKSNVQYLLMSTLSLTKTVRIYLKSEVAAGRYKLLNVDEADSYVLLKVF